MTTAFFSTLDGAPCGAVRVSVPWSGVWTAEVELHDEREFSGQVDLVLGETTMRGTVDPARSGTFAGRTRVFLVAGAGSWGKAVASRAYHNDAGVKLSAVVVDAAKEAGETAVVSSSADRSLGVDWVREAGPASRVLEALGVPWHVGVDGVTRIGERSTRDVSKSVQALEHNPVGRAVVLSPEGADLSVLLPGSTVTDEARGLSAFVAHDVELVVESARVRAVAYGGASRAARLVSVLRSLAREGDPRRAFHGLYRYRVFRMELGGAGPRVELQVVNRDLGLPDVLPVALVPGIAGGWAKLAAGAVVVVAFLDGDPAAPVMVGATPKGDPGHLPADLVLDASENLKLGETSLLVALSTAEDFLALAGKVDAEFSKVSATLGSATAPSGGGAVTYGTPYVAASTAAAKVKGT